MEMTTTAAAAYKVTTHAITTDPWQFVATVIVNGVSVQTIHGDTNQDRREVRRLAVKWINGHWDDPRVMAALTNNH